MLHLLNPSEKNILDNAGDRVPLGLLSIAANTPGHVRVYDLNHMSIDDYMNAFEKEKPEAVGISVYTSPSFTEATNLAKKLKGRTRLIAGGHHASSMPGTLVGYFDSIVIGEGEGAFEDSLYKSGFVKQDVIVEQLKNPDLTQLDMRNYGINGNQGTIITSRGCPYSCAFCSNTDRNVRKVPVDNVRQQISQLKEYGFKSIYFLDDVFTLDNGRMQSILRDINVPFRVTTRANLLNDRKLETLAMNGCDTISLGIESGNDKILSKVNKGMTTSHNYAAVRKANDFGIKTKGFFIIGLPGETEYTAKQTIDFSLKLKEQGMTQADFYYLTPFPGTKIWKYPEQFEISIRNRDFTKYLQAGKKAKCVIDTKYLKAERIEELVKEAKSKWKK